LIDPTGRNGSRLEAFDHAGSEADKAAFDGSCSAIEIFKTPIKLI
jgi:hypothetical protein